MRETKPQDLSALPIRDAATGHVFAVIETPRGSRNKYGYDPDLGVFKLNGVLPLGTFATMDVMRLPLCILSGSASSAPGRSSVATIG